MAEAGQTIGERIYLIREALGTRRDPMPLDKFAALIAARTGAVYDKSIISRMETGDRKVTLEDVDVIAAVDPKTRGRAWLAFGDEGGSMAATAPTTPDIPLVHRVVPKTVYRLDDDEKQPGKPVKKKRGPSAMAG